MRFEAGSLFAGYTVVSRLGRGGMATVYLVREPGIDRLVALKVLPEQLVDEEQFSARFEQEARLIGSANLCGPGMALTDAVILPFVRQFAAIDRVWFASQPLPALQAWLARHLASALFDAAMVKLAPWQHGDAPVVFPA